MLELRDGGDSAKKMFRSIVGLIFGLHLLASGVAAEPLSWTLEGNSPGADFGFALARGGDINGDGKSEILVAAVSQTFDQQSEGAAYLFLGGALGPVVPSFWTAQGNSVGATFGRSLAFVGDTNGDGLGDYLVGAPGLGTNGHNSGGVFLYLGTPGGPPAATPAWSFLGSQANASVGFAVAAAGDVNHDGLADVLVGAPRATNGQLEEGQVFVFYGSSQGLPMVPSITYEANRSAARFGYSVAGLGDVNGDGFDDVGISGSWFDPDQRGRIFVYYGSSQGLPATPSWQVAEPATVPSAPEYGESIAGAGDINGDGYDDLVVGGPYHSWPQPEEGIAVVYLGSSNGLQLAPAWIVSSHHHLLNGARFGISVAGAGDYNADGFDDLIIGAYLHSSGISQQGAAFLYLGSAAGPRTFPVEMVAGEQNDSNFGSAVSGAGDVNGDGFDDFLVGSPSYGNGQSGEGKVYLYFGEAVNPVFFDGFESGNTSAWSSVVP